MTRSQKSKNVGVVDERHLVESCRSSAGELNRLAHAFVQGSAFHNVPPGP